MEALISEQIARGRFQSAAEAVKAGLRLLAQSEEWDEAALEAELLKGLASGEARDMTDADWNKVGRN